ncbi:MAG TPA: bifunctional proline dehydrogenase/L-glutamate gamma-semialdehyde dehydrogenase PutA [Steroidobacteraceae bacterium]|nr:bifunctional proline dehydrogenase/L-glutamate gamma-semialdehyde dehydrogenase PutA [Steroidobacteraceae bacterium]
MAESPAPHAFIEEASSLLSEPGRAINAQYLAPEERIVRALIAHARLDPPRQAAVQARALALVEAVRSDRASAGALDALLREYHLASREGVILMCLAEALLRIPDADTADRLIADKIGAGAWDEHLGDSASLLVNASTWGLMLTGRLVEIDRGEIGSARAWLGRLASRIGEPLARAALRQAMRVLGQQFVMGRTIGEALERAARQGAYRYSFDMLGEAALTAEDAERYLQKYRDAIAAIGAAAPLGRPLEERPGISVKLSALHPRYEPAQRARVLRELAPRLTELVERARGAGIALTVDAEEADRLELSLLLIEEVLASEATHGYAGFGLAVQAYQKRAYAVVSWLVARARARARRVTVRLVKGAYWDSEIKRAQERGLAGFPVFTRKANTDVSYLACAQLLAASTDAVFPQFATHNAQTVAYITELMGAGGAFEFQRLHGMGEELYGEVIARGGACRVYAPVGAHEDLLPYLVRRLLENGANTSFVNRIVDERLPAAEVVTDPVAEADRARPAAHPRIAEPERLYDPERRNSRGVNFADATELERLKAACELAARAPWHAGARIGGEAGRGARLAVRNPADGTAIGSIALASLEDVERALALAAAAQSGWERRPVDERARMLERAAELFEERSAELIARCVLEAGKTVPDSVAEVREAVDFLRYYAAQARTLLGAETVLPGPTGERNTLRLRGRGLFACVSPWNFPLSIFTGQIAAALVAGNVVLAKPAEQTPLTAALACELLHGAGIPADALQFLPGEGASVGGALTGDPRLAGVAFTGSNETARLIERNLAARSGPIAALIAETGGVNALIADSSALPEQLVLDAAYSGFNSAGQRCSALRVLLLQEEIAARVLELLEGCMDELALGDPALLATDVGPVIDRDALAMLEAHAARITASAPWYHRARLPSGLAGELFFAPLAVEIAALDALEREVFGPIVHIVRYRARDLESLLDALNAKGYGLTLGIHTRIDSLALAIAARARVGNVYVNRNMIGAVVGVQPFGGMGLSGTGPKAGGPHYLPRFTTEQTLTINTAALGGNASLLTL